MSRAQKIDFAILLVLALAAIPVVLLGHVRFLTSSILFLGVPSLYLIIRRTQNLKVILSGVFLIGIVLGFGFDFLNTLNNSWLVPDNELVIPYRILGAAPVDEVICLVLWSLLILLVYEHFLEKKRRERVDKRHIFAVSLVPASLSLLAVIFVFFWRPSLVMYDHSYLLLGALASLPVVYCIFRRPKLLWRIVKAAPYFIFLFLAFELTSLFLGQWQFNGQYLGFVNIFSLRFPFEEFIFWIFVSSTVVMTDYKLFVDP